MLLSLERINTENMPESECQGAQSFFRPWCASSDSWILSVHTIFIVRLFTRARTDTHTDTARSSSRHACCPWHAAAAT
eukprot:COSAG03_NODE_1581_length_3838_cov_6.094092_1_plen_77_part_10